MKRTLLTAAVLAALTGLSTAPLARASISDSEELTRIGGLGSGAGQLDRPTGLASDPLTGHLFVVENANHRVSEFTPWGDFVKAFGFDVAPGAVNEEQEVRVRASAGEFKLSFEGQSTPDLPFDASAVEVQAALNALPAIGPSASVSVESVAGTDGGATPFVHVVSFEGGLAATDVDELEAADGATPLSGAPEPNLMVRTRADGTAGGTGLESCTATSGCKIGLVGAKAGQMNSGIAGIAVDETGNVYVKELNNLRVQKFDEAGGFVWAAGGKVDKTTNANLCTATSGDECGAGVAGAGPAEFAAGFSEGLAFCSREPLCGPTGALFVTDAGRIQRFSLDGEYVGELAVPGEVVEALAFEPVGEDLYASYVGKDGIRKLDGSSGAEIGQPRKGSYKIASNAAGELFAVSEFKMVLEYDAAGAPMAPPSCCAALPQPPPNEGQLFTLNALGTNGAGDLHVASVADADSYVRVYGPPPLQYEGPPPVPPTVTAQFASSVQSDGATVAALIDPHFFADTRFYVQFGTQLCSGGGCTNEVPAPPGQLLSTKVSSGAVRSAGVFLEGLMPGTTYHYRFVAQSSGGGPVLGAEASFTTPDPMAQPACPNDVFRGGASARLPDCRAYEMASPVDKNNGDIKTLVDFVGFQTALSQSSANGNELTYSSSRSFGTPKGAPLTNQYLARRVWASAAIDPGQGPAAGLDLTPDATGNPYKLFSPDLCTGWFVVAVEPLLNPPRDFANYQNVYRRDFCGGRPDEALLPVKPTTPLDPENPSERFSPELQGASADGGAAIVRVRDRLVPEQVGSQLSCSTTTSATTISYRWLRNGVAIGGATASTYTVTAVDEGKAIQCQVTTVDAGAGSTQVANPALPVGPLSATEVPSAPAEIAAPRPSAALTVGGPGGQSLSCDPNEDGWGGDPSFSYQWYRNGAAIGGAAVSTYAVTAGDLASAAVFQCAVTGTNAGGSATKVSANLATDPAPSPAAPQANANMPRSWRLYYANGGELAAVCVLPDGSPVAGNCSGGTGKESPNLPLGELNRFANVSGAISADGQRVYWTDSGTKASGTGTVYLRINPGAEQSEGSSCETGKACTVKVSGTKTPQPSRFLGANPDGSKALFEVTAGAFNEDLYAFDAKKGSSTLVAGEVVGVAATSKDLSRIYFVSKEALAPGASAGQPNLYLAEGEARTFVATLSSVDVAPLNIPSNTARAPIYHVARASADGDELAFISTRSLTGYDNADEVSGVPDSEVYLYEAGATAPVCVSCNPSGARPKGRAVKGNGNVPGSLPTAAALPAPQNMLYAPRALSDDGERLFFESFDALLPRDVNGAKDVYEWESAASKAACAQMGSELYVAASGGCLSLISSGESPQDSEFADASASGNDVFFITNASLLPQDPGLYDVYDARVGGGLPTPVAPTECQGETCKPPATAPNDPTPASSNYVGPGDVKEKKAKKKQKKNQKQQKKKGKGKKGKKKQSQKRGARR